MNKDHKITIGGEKVLSFDIIFSRAKNNIFSTYNEEFKDYEINYTYGGHYSLLAIIDDLGIVHTQKKILVPSYTCSSIIDTLKIKNISYIFYKVDDQLKIDFNDVKRKYNLYDCSALLVIDYMGKSQFVNINPYLNELKKNGIKIIQDSVHSLCLNKYEIYGDYAYNSLRKILPFEGSLLISKEKMKINFATGINFKFLCNKRLGQITRYLHLTYNLFRPDTFLKFFSNAEGHYNADKIYKLYGFQKRLIEKIDLKKSTGLSRKYYNELLDKFKNYTLHTFITNDFYPFGFFLIHNNRDAILKALRKNGIFCPIHWKLNEEIDASEFSDSYKISKSCLTIPLYEMDDIKIKYLIDCLRKNDLK